MPWNEVSAMSLRHEFVMLATVEGANVRELCRRYGISRKTAYKWIDRFKTAGPTGLEERSRRAGVCFDEAVQPTGWAASSAPMPCEPGAHAGG
jgi:transposase-like protein